MVREQEEARLDALRNLHLLDTAPSNAFDRITRMASELFKLPVSAVSLTDVDRQWFKSRVGVTHNCIPREKAPCAEVAETTALLVVPDLLADVFYKDSHLVRSGIRFYAGAPLTTRDGFGLGAMCVLGVEPREFSLSEQSLLADLAAMVMAQVELQHAFGRIDTVSGMPNRCQFSDDLEDLARDRPCSERRFAVLVDLASPEQLSNALRVMGASFVDDLVRDGARMIRAAIGPERKAYHVAATQFVLLAPESADEGIARALAADLQRLRFSPRLQLEITTGIGVAPFVLGELSADDVLRIAHSAAQDARLAPSKISIYSSTSDLAFRRRFDLLNDFGAALEAADQLRLVFQPRIDLASGICIGAEALLRWHHPRLRDVGPGEFIPLVEQTSMARATTAWVLDRALKQLAVWQKAGIAVQISINISPADVAEPRFAEHVAKRLAAYGVSPDRLELEITENAVMEDADRSLATLKAIARTGTRIAIDDFGTGYSSLSYLHRLPVDVVKIDRSFMRGLAADENKRSLVCSMISLSQTLGYRVVAEGVETSDELNIVKSTRCDEVQGYYFSRPLLPDRFATWYSRAPAPQVLPINRTGRRAPFLATG